MLLTNLPDTVQHVTCLRSLSNICEGEEEEGEGEGGGRGRKKREREEGGQRRLMEGISSDLGARHKV